MAAALERAWDAPLEGVVGHTLWLRSAVPPHPRHRSGASVPDEAGLAASRTLLEQVGGLTRRRSRHRADLGRRLGAAAVAAAGFDARRRDRRQPGAARLRRADLRDEHVRKHVSTIKGGRLAAAASPAKVVSLVVSDIPGDNPALVASGPTIADAGPCRGARLIVAAYRMALPAAVIAHLASPQRGAASRRPAFRPQRGAIIASARCRSTRRQPRPGVRASRP